MANDTLQYLTVSGLPLSFAFDWPFHKSVGGADFHVLHGDMRLEDGSGLHCLVSVHLSARPHSLRLPVSANAHRSKRL